MCLGLLAQRDLEYLAQAGLAAREAGQCRKRDSVARWVPCTLAPAATRLLAPAGDSGAEERILVPRRSGFSTP